MNSSVERKNRNDMNIKNIDDKSSNRTADFDKVKTSHISFSRFNEEEKGFYLSRLLVEDVSFERDQLTISLHRKDLIAAENRIDDLGYGTMRSQKKSNAVS